MKVTLLKYCASDLDVVNAARVSFGKRVEEMDVANEKLIFFLLKNNHGTPFEHGYFQFHVEAPIAVFREWHRHRIGHSYNEMSGRYVEMEEAFFVPDNFRKQVGKPGAYTFEPLEDETLLPCFQEVYEYCWNYYQLLLSKGVAKEQARLVLPLGTYSQMYWSCNPRSLMHFISLRNKEDAMEEIRYLANEVQKNFTNIMPVTAAAYSKLHETT